MRTKILAGLAIAAVGVVISCGDDLGEDDRSPGGGGSQAGAGGTALGGSGGKGGVGGTGGSAGQGGSGGMGGSPGTGGAGGVGGSAGAPVECTPNKAKFTQKFETDADLWDVYTDDPTYEKAPKPRRSDLRRHMDAWSMEFKLDLAPKDVMGDGGVADGGIGDGGVDAGLVVVTPDASGDVAGDAPVGAERKYYFVLNAAAKKAYLQAGRIISAWIYVPADNDLSVFRFGLYDDGNGGYNDNSMVLADLRPGVWTQISYTIPAAFNCAKVAAGGFLHFEFAIPAGKTFRGSIFVDDFEISAAPQ